MKPETGTRTPAIGTPCGKVAKAGSNKNQRIKQTSQSSEIAHAGTLPFQNFRIGPNKASRRRPESDRNSGVNLFHCGRFCCQRQLRFALIFRVYESDLGQADKCQNVAQIRFLKIELRVWRSGRVSAAARCEHVHFLAGQEFFRPGFCIRKRLAEAHNLVQPSLEPRRNREVMHGIADDDDIRRLQFLDQLVRVLQCGAVCSGVLSRV
jgi:hypothetical protein